jgi:hypothetical protein
LNFVPICINMFWFTCVFFWIHFFVILFISLIFLKLHPFCVDDPIFVFRIQTCGLLLFVYFRWKIIFHFFFLMCGNLCSKIIAFVKKVTLKWDFVVFEIVSP